MAHVVRTQGDLLASSTVFIRQQVLGQTFTDPGVVFQSDVRIASGFGQQCQDVARMIAAGIQVPVYKMAIRGFDTHTNQGTPQWNGHGTLIGSVAKNLAALRLALIEKGVWDRGWS